VERQDASVFSFISKHKVEFSLNNNLVKLLRIDTPQTVDYIAQQASQQASSKDADDYYEQSVQAIEYYYKWLMEQYPSDFELYREQEYLKFVFMEELFQRNKTLGKQYHTELIELAIKFDKDRLLNILKYSNYYDRFEILKLCQKHKLFNEQAFLNIVIGKKEEAVQIMVNQCIGDNTKTIIDLAVEFNLNDDVLWDRIIAKS
jgi:hypothetical protein